MEELNKFGKKGILAFTSVATLACLTFVAGCSAPQAKLTYAAIANTGGADGTGFPFVVPRTLMKVTVVADKDGGPDNVTFSTVPTSASANDPKATLLRFVATDSSSGWSLTPTVVSSVTYADNLIVSSLGTQVSDNRSDAVDAVVKIAAAAGAFASAKVPDCNADVPGAKDASGKPITYPLKPFTVDVAKAMQGKIQGSPCWGYSLTSAAYQPSGRTSNDVATTLASQGGAVGWFPIPVCKSYDVKVYRCDDEACIGAQGDKPQYAATVSISDGVKYQKIPLPAKGKISLHADYCDADVTNDSVGTSNWALLKELASDINSEKK